MKNNVFKKIVTRVAAAVLAACMLFGSASAATTQEVQAANLCSTVYGSLRNTVTFKVTTGSGWITGQSITLNQSKGTAYNGNYGWGGSTYQVYGAYSVTIKRIKGSGKVPAGFTWKSGSKRISLGKNSTYQITITPLTETFYYNSWGKFLKYDHYKFYSNWRNIPTWNVKKTNHVSFCV